MSKTGSYSSDCQAPMTSYCVTWSVDIEVCGDHKAAAQAVADLYFQSRIAAGESDAACCFEVVGPDGRPAQLDLGDSLSELEGDDTE